ncbi:hypothetical protein GCM10007242_41480 [Pigmentiphaga litoralis]|uniref:head-tail connector protein n=1 Tax=Pigmentiphaga litoralis TaxID=516702 RepID=UPI001671DF93|nr:head-tail connector protein [Pigmentiphaga litoralis]GGX30538.1 hypothetical protein GCM10007242_41480 [Pigmentiphaga litoralis]
MAAARLTLERVRKAVRIDEGEVDDSMLHDWIITAYSAVENHLFRRVYDSVDELLVDPSGVLVDEVINQAVCLLVGHFNRYREAGEMGAVTEIPFGVEWLLRNYVNMAGGA